MKSTLLSILISEAFGLHLLPSDWNENYTWQDETYCTLESDKFIVFDMTED